MLAPRIVAMDHIGFGISDQADFEMVDMHHAANLLQMRRHLDLQDITLVTHDWGGPIGIGALIQEPQRVTAMLAMNTTVFPMPPDGFTYKNYPFPWLPWYLTPHLIPDAPSGGVATFGNRPTTESYVARVTSRAAFRKAYADQMVHFDAADATRALSQSQQPNSAIPVASPCRGLRCANPSRPLHR